MTQIRLTLVIALSLVLGFSPAALAGAPGSGGRLANIEAFCQGGDMNGLRCDIGADCPHGTCQITLDGTRQRPLQFIATMVIDDDTGEWNEDQVEENIHTVSVSLEFIVRGQRRVVAQNYMNVKGQDAAALIENMKQGVEVADLPNSDRRLDEALAVGAVRDGGIIDDFLFQRPDSRMEDELRHYFKTDGNFVVIRNRGLRVFSNQEDSTLATVLRTRLDVVVTPAD